MKKAATKTTGPANIGSKRTCTKCQTKFYDFNKEEMTCPKCGHSMVPKDFISVAPLKSESRKKSIEQVTTEGLMQSEDSIPEPLESADDSNDDEDDTADDNKGDDEDDSDY